MFQMFQQDIIYPAFSEEIRCLRKDLENILQNYQSRIFSSYFHFGINKIRRKKKSVCIDIESDVAPHARVIKYIYIFINIRSDGFTENLVT